MHARRSSAPRTFRTSRGYRLVQHGTVLSEVPIRPGPTQSVFDVLVALALVPPAMERLALLGFAAGGMMAALRAVAESPEVMAVDLDPKGYRLFREHCQEWAGRLVWAEAEAGHWLRESPHYFDAVVDDLSVAVGGDVIKPAISWEGLARLARSRLSPGGVYVANLFPPLPGSWMRQLAALAEVYRCVRVVLLEEFENRVAVAGEALPSARLLGRQLRETLRRMGSQQADRCAVRQVTG